MTETKCGIMKATPMLPVIDLLRVPHKNAYLDVSFPAFGPSTYDDNVKKMQKTYAHPEKFPRLTFREPTTSESISVAAYDFGNMAKPQIFDPRWLQLGRVVRTSEGVYVNSPRDTQGLVLTDEGKLKHLLNKANRVNGIYLGKNDFGFAPYETFEKGVQDCDTFSQGGLARVLEHTDEKTVKNLREIASPKKFYKIGVNVWGYGEVKEPIVRVASLGSSRNLDDSRLLVFGNWCDRSQRLCVWGA